MRVLVTGALGFVGTHATQHLLARGHEVTAASLEGDPVRGAEKARPLRLDIRDRHVLVRALERESPGAILHLAAIAFVPQVQRDPGLGFETNVQGVVNLLAAAREAAPGARIVLASSPEVYGKVAGEAPLAESLPLKPATLYGATKAAAELAARAFAQEGLDVVVLRPFNHFGPGQDESYVVASFARQVAALETQGGGILRHGNLDAVRDFLDVRDVVRAYEISLAAPRGKLAPGEPYNVCSGRGTAIRDIVAQLVSLARAKIACEVDEARLRAIDVPRSIGDPRRFREATGFAPEIPLERTLADVLDAARAKEPRAGRA